jgi:hypothetical protein
MAFNPKNRISAADALEHKWIVKNATQSVDYKSVEKAFDNIRKFSVYFYFIAYQQNLLYREQSQKCNRQP